MSDGAGVVIASPDGLQLAEVDTRGRLLTSTLPGTPPPGATAVGASDQNTLNMPDDIDLNVPGDIPAGVVLNIDRLVGGSEAKAKIELRWMQSGNPEEVLEVIYVNASSNSFPLDWQSPVLGNGDRIRLRLTPYQNNIEVYGKWEGYYQ